MGKPVEETGASQQQPAKTQDTGRASVAPGPGSGRLSKRVEI